MQFFYISSKNLIENKIISNTKPRLNNEIITKFLQKHTSELSFQSFIKLDLIFIII